MNSSDPKGLYAEQSDVGWASGGFAGGFGWGGAFEGLGSNSGMNSPDRPRTLACLGGTCVRTDDSCEINGQAFAPGALECGGLALAIAAAAPKKKGPPTDPCPAYIRNFFSYIPLFEGMAESANTDVDFIMALSSLETGWLCSPNSQPVPGASNLFGASNAAEQVLGYSNYSESADAWVKRWTPRVDGVTDATTFAANLVAFKLNGVTGSYNSHEGYAAAVVRQVGTVNKWKALCEASKPK